MSNTIEYYLQHGFSRPYAEYFAAGRRKIVTVTPNPDFSLNLLFDNGEKRRLECRPLFVKDGNSLPPVDNYDNFSKVYLNELKAVAWNEQIDICPDFCYVESVPMENARQT